MLNMQNVKDIEITEGKVRTIHDKDSRLIWCRLAYDTKYAGDTYQQTYNSDNLFDVSTFVMGGMTNGHITTSSTRITNITMPLKVYPNTTYTISVNLGGDIMGFRIGIHQLDANKAFISDSNWQQLVPDPYTFTTGPNTEFIGIVCSCSTTSTTVTTNSTESGYNASNPTQWLRGCTLDIIGDYISPSPDAPTPVQTVTGEQTVTVSDGVDSEDFTISLGAIELCKIGDYQDYIYKSGDDWYLHKECGKAVFNGTESWSGGTSTGSPTYLYAYTAALDSLSLYSARQAFCSHFTIAPNQLATATEVSYPCMSVVTPSAETYAHIRLMIPLTIAATTSALRTWLGSHNTNLYYVLATPTDTQITDATLLGQLEAVHEWLTRYGYNATVTGTLPIIINQTNL